MTRRIPTAEEAVMFLATRHVAEQPDQKLEFGWPEIEAANDEYERKGVSGMMLHADAESGKVVVQYIAWRDAEARIDEGERRQREYHRVWSPVVCKSTGVPLVVMESQRRQLAELRAAAAARAVILKEADGAVGSDSRSTASGAERV